MEEPKFEKAVGAKLKDKYRVKAPDTTNCLILMESKTLIKYIKK